MGRRPNMNSLEDRLLVQKGCFVLNKMGVGPKYRFEQYIRGPYSSDLARDCIDIMKEKKKTYETDVHPECIQEISVLIGKGTPFLEAFTTLELALSYNPGRERNMIIEFVMEMIPHLKEKITEASEYQIIHSGLGSGAVPLLNSS